MIQILRWLILIPACVASWYVVLIVGIFLHGVLFSYCPPELVAYGMFCDAEWFPAAEGILICLCVAASAALVVATATIVAPSHRVFVSRLALAVGIVVAAAMAIHSGNYAAFASAAVAGAITTLAIGLILKRAQRRTDNVA